MRVFVVGANGQTGRELVMRLRLRGDEPVAGLGPDEDGEDW